MTLMLDFETLMQPDLTSLVTKYGLTSLEPVKNLLVKLCGCDPTFGDLPKKLHVAAFCLDTGQTEYFSEDTVPDGRVIDFVAMSIAVPFLFECVRYRGKVYVDGGMIESVPMNPFLGHRKEEVRAIRLIVNHQHDEEEITTFKTFVTRLVRFGLRCVEYEGARVITVSHDIFNFSLGLEDRLRMFFTPLADTDRGGE